MMDEKIIYVGNKPLMNYVLAVVTQINENTNSVILKARGKAISRAVDVAEIVRNRFIPDCVVDNIEISTDEVENEDGSKLNVSVIAIKLSND
ncbi:MAG: DNA-binding protein Alba [Methanobrevibacter sp.]|uniref:DNA-binding protein Alba n=1 Tax=Methanobrevibacter sp. TaxID=66852 RepID=UPI0026DEC20F|nr:DNA-binding protein Alba [Methanobrevibacter sp.]MDO5849550.1 DNA-binding protein Alba [Methanobrevibacter sp.]